MLCQQSNHSVTPLTPVSTQHSDLSPRSSNSSFASNDSLINGSSSLPSPAKDNLRTVSHHQGLSALQRLEFALERNSLFSALMNEADDASATQSSKGRLVKPCPSSTSSCASDTVPHIKLENNNGSDNSSDTGMKTHTPASSPDDGTSPANIIFQCPLCSVVCNSRHEFNEHLVTHSQQHACPKCSFLTDNEDSLREHVHEAHDVSDFEVLTDEEARTPKTNSQGKVKTFKCKQCGYYATTKMDFWEHTKTHIRSEKMLTCPKCPFVTEYKHHLEYHLRNHFGSKPFQCNKCPYSCVNKSMLNSHLKSHSNIYQYRCADCSYATKYCHSLKLHLRKYNHKPAMVLNPDGTPNPLPIIDVYGTRRGPKVKRSPSDQSNIAPIQELLSPPERVKEKPPKSHKNAKRSARESRSTPVPVSTAHCTTPPISPQFVKQEIKNEFIPQSRPSPRNEPSRTELSNTNMDFGRVNNNELLQQRTQQSPMQVPVMNSMSPSAIQGLLMSNSARGTVNPAAAIALQSLFMQNSGHQNVMDLVVKNPMELYAAALNQYILGNSVLQISSPMDFAKVAEEQRSNIMAQLMQQNANIQLIQQSSSPNHVEQKQNHSPALQTPMTNNMNHHTPLDLRNHRSVDDNANEFGEDLKRRKRKGKAHRYDRERDMNPNPQDCDEAIDFSNNNGKVVNPNMNGLNQMKAMKSEESLACRYCDISFPPVLHSLHMKFHSNDADPFRCNACGEKTSDKVSFFVHLANASH